jgi:SET domain-containing protein
MTISNQLGFINHNDDPSTEALEVPWKNRWHRIYVATRDIPEGEELTVSYGE